MTNIYQVREPKELAKANQVQVVYEVMDQHGAFDVVAAEPFSARILTSLEVRLPTGKRIVLDFYDGSFSIEDMENENYPLVYHERELVYTEMSN